ncbi:hypothetical protein EON65_38210 [archaeon]|nr:MAG: hypothetical protein EON65_38210 [archaeon]
MFVEIKAVWDENGGFGNDVLWYEDDYLGDSYHISNQTTSETSNEVSCCVKRKHNNDYSNSAVLTKKKKRTRRGHRFPRVLKSDLRRFLGMMFVNTMNSADCKLITQFFGNFCLSSCTSEYYARKKQFERLEGVQHTVQHIVHHISRIPDLVLEIECNSVVQRVADAGSKVILKATLKGTDMSPPNFHSARPFHFSALYTFSLDTCHRILKFEFDGDFDEHIIK